MLDNESPSVLKALQEIRLSISILFAFLRRPNLDATILNDVKAWTQSLVTLLLRFATSNDHLFILHHILRCPIEIASWARNFVQVPIKFGSSPFTSSSMYHISSLLSTLLSPTKNRNEFIMKHKEFFDPSAANEDVWVVVDSDGEDNTNDSLAEPNENDVVAIFDQIPFQALFACITCAIRKNDGFYIDSQAISGYHVLQSISFCAKLIEYFGQGLRTFEGEKYRQFSKRLARIIKHVVQYISEMQEILNTTSRPEDSKIRLRIHLEHNILVLKACYWIYKSQKVGAWQYLVGIPFELLSKEALYKLYYAFTTEFQYEIIEDFQTNFAAKTQDPKILIDFGAGEISSEDIFYLLQVFASMANSRDTSDYDFVTTIAVGLYRVSDLFLS